MCDNNTAKLTNTVVKFFHTIYTRTQRRNLLIFVFGQNRMITTSAWYFKRWSMDLKRSHWIYNSDERYVADKKSTRKSCIHDCEYEIFVDVVKKAIFLLKQSITQHRTRRVSSPNRLIADNVRRDVVR